MLTRRHFLNGTFGAGLTLAVQPALPQAARPQRRIIVDSQIHMWKASTPDRPWVPGTRPQLPEPMTIERVVPMIDEAGVDRVVIVPPTLEGERVDYGQEAARRYPGRFATMGHIRLDDPGEARRLPAWRQQPAVLGIRLNIAGAQAKWLTDGTTDWFWPAAEKAGIPIMFLTTGQTSLFGRIAEHHPQLVLIIDHMGIPSETVRNNAIPAAFAASDEHLNRVGLGAADVIGAVKALEKRGIEFITSPVVRTGERAAAAVAAAGGVIFELVHATAPDAANHAFPPTLA